MFFYLIWKNTVVFRIYPKLRVNVVVYYSKIDDRESGRLLRKSIAWRARSIILNTKNVIKIDKLSEKVAILKIVFEKYYF